VIEKIEIDGYRLLHGFEADLKALNVVVGANATGKSSLIDWLQLMSYCCRLPISSAFGQFDHPMYLLSADSNVGEMRWKIGFRGDLRDFVYEAAFKPDWQGRIEVKHEMLRYRDADDGHDVPLKLLEASPLHKMVFDKAKRELVPFDDGGESDGSVNTPPSTELKDQAGSFASQESMPEVSSLLSQMQQFPNRFPVPCAAHSYLSNFTSYPGFDVTRSSNLRTKPAEISPVTWLMPEGDNLGMVLHEFKNRHDLTPTFERLKEYLRAAFPTFADIGCETTHGSPPRLLVKWLEKGAVRPMEVWDLSDGNLRFLCLAAALLNPVPPSLVAIDEPELGLHPGLLPVVADMIKEGAERTQVLVTTHSPDLLNCFDIEDVAVMVRPENELRTIWHRPSNRESLKRLLQDVMGDSLGDLHRSGELEAGA